jgi:hypothetical protein
MNNRSKEEVDDDADNLEPEKSDAGGEDSEDKCMFNGKTVKDPSLSLLPTILNELAWFVLSIPASP